MAQKRDAWLAPAGNGMQILMVDNGGGPVEASRPMWPTEAAEVLARYKAQDWELLNDHRYESLEDSMFHNGNRDKFPSAPKPPKGWRLW